jgi:hypothetical protein
MAITASAAPTLKTNLESPPIIIIHHTTDEAPETQIAGSASSNDTATAPTLTTITDLGDGAGPVVFRL